MREVHCIAMAGSYHSLSSAMDSASNAARSRFAHLPPGAQGSPEEGVWPSEVHQASFASHTTFQYKRFVNTGHFSILFVEVPKCLLHLQARHFSFGHGVLEYYTIVTIFPIPLRP